MSFPSQEICHLLGLRKSWDAGAGDILAQLNPPPLESGGISFDDLVKIGDLEIADCLVGTRLQCTVDESKSFHDLLIQIEPKWRLAVAMAYQRAAREGIDANIALIPTAPLSKDPTGGFKHMGFVPH